MSVSAIVRCGVCVCVCVRVCARVCVCVIDTEGRGPHLTPQEYNQTLLHNSLTPFDKLQAPQLLRVCVCMSVNVCVCVCVCV